MSTLNYSHDSKTVTNQPKLCEISLESINEGPLPMKLPTGPPEPPGLRALCVVAEQSIPNQNIPPGLEYLTVIDQIFVHQHIEMLELWTGCEMENKYAIKNLRGQNIFSASEQSSFCDRLWCCSGRPFNMKITDNFGNVVIHISRPLRCQSFLFPCCLQTIEISSPPGNLIGTVQQNWSIFPKFDVKDANGDVVLKIEGPFFTSSCCGNDVDFPVLSRKGKIKVGEISKQWAGLIQEMHTDADNFRIKFPMDLDVKMKAVLLSACLLIDYMYFESSPGSRSRCCCSNCMSCIQYR